ncbi:hypothetical protein Celal_0149 [Cellulophaga algicola DSM 14237]|uniref:Uncharacterized protein n=1 Tax=Cellulophaga algicola (strain DSM 14237 / IC166 / ACAM 630) TaxID=688270 RepID=E6X753_CELAD|nr:hypothetical protein [Cellulophaga algicola]ADV47502.1 hypothetical protein Celal_0149 [Cellulophaga algicola DSM 14237]
MKKALRTASILLIMTTLFWNCKSEKAISETEFEQAVFYEIFPEIIDAIYVDIRKVPPPPPPPDFLEKRGYDVKSNHRKAYDLWEKSDENQNRNNAWVKKKDSLHLDASPTYLIIYDTIAQFEEGDVQELKKHFKHQNIVLPSKAIALNHGYTIDLKQLKTNHENLKFKYQSEFPNGREFWRTQYNFHTSGLLGFNRILFDTTKTYGVLNGSFGLEFSNTVGFRIFIKKTDNGLWTIDEVIETWAS